MGHGQSLIVISQGRGEKRPMGQGVEDANHIGRKFGLKILSPGNFPTVRDQHR